MCKCDLHCFLFYGPDGSRCMRQVQMSHSKSKCLNVWIWLDLQESISRNKPWAAVFFGDSAGHVFRVKPNCLLFVLRELLQLLLSFLSVDAFRRGAFWRGIAFVSGAFCFSGLSSLSLEGSSDREGASKPV